MHIIILKGLSCHLWKHVNNKRSQFKLKNVECAREGYAKLSKWFQEWEGLSHSKSSYYSRCRKQNIKSLEIKLVPRTTAKTLVNDIFKFGIIKLKAYITFREQQLPEGQSESCWLAWQIPDVNSKENMS